MKINRKLFTYQGILSLKTAYPLGYCSQQRRVLLTLAIRRPLSN